MAARSTHLNTEMDLDGPQRRINDLEDEVAQLKRQLQLSRKSRTFGQTGFGGESAEKRRRIEHSAPGSSSSAPDTGSDLGNLSSNLMSFQGGSLQDLPSFSKLWQPGSALRPTIADIPSVRFPRGLVEGTDHTMDEVLELIDVYDENSPNMRRPAAELDQPVLALLEPYLEAFRAEVNHLELKKSVTTRPKCFTTRVAGNTISHDVFRNGMETCEYCRHFKLLCIMVCQKSTNLKPCIMAQPAEKRVGLAPDSLRYWIGD